MKLFQLKTYQLIKVAVIGLTIGLISACSAQDKPAEPAEKTDWVCVTMANHTDKFVESYSINGQAGGNDAGAYGSANGSGSCGLQLPVKWREGLVGNVKWTYADTMKLGDQLIGTAIWHTASAPIPKYDTLERLRIHLMPNNEVRFTFLTREEMDNPSIPYPVEPKNLPDNFYQGRVGSPQAYACANLKLNNMTVKQCIQAWNEYTGNTPKAARENMILSCQNDNNILETETVPQCIKRNFPKEWAKNEYDIRNFSKKFSREWKADQFETQGEK